MNAPNNTENLEPFSTSSLVELSVVTQQSGGDGIADDMKSFAEQLKPYPFYVHIKKMYIV